jgi:hypothetical protein
MLTLHLDLSPLIINISLAVTLQFSREKYIALYGKQEKIRQR